MINQSVEWSIKRQRQRTICQNPLEPEVDLSWNGIADGQAIFPFFAGRRPKVSVIIPALNEAKNLPYVLSRIPKWIHELILVPGHSTDNTVEVAQELWPSVRIVQQEGRGKGAALRSGFAAGTGDIIVMLDADGSMNPEEIPSFVGLLLSGADFVKGSRFVQGGGTHDMEFYRKLGNWFFTVTSNVLFGGSFSDLCYGYNAFWAYVLPELQLDADGFEIETMMNVRALRARLRVAEIPSYEAPRIHGTSNLRTLPDGWRVLKTLFRERMKREGHMAQGHQLNEQLIHTEVVSGD